ncbi:hypothetical protein OPV22_029546 [Ensete ventricosum]|uniref:Uncharacterized protein n=1 Tax=Ensete ventricosum TaxID=4639 RepID=A0A426ZRM1_ENSVE|nr:hypothetical protein OPV22_029546 [Ensete ventricosum]RRT66659.1 hypothetical protein B296_00040038 [Ensete ventricosum]RWW19716.1 hypothetical protein GW17_00016207 [Ensete ventricosum]RWW87523.1 hypothetical protein BHE74_00003654 [Ensete ventricosum]RZR76382.1 hypothetical protein BHM03_00001116 [Ensete ventricosum]
MARKPSDPPEMMPPQTGLSSVAFPPGRRWQLIVKEKQKPKLGARLAEAAGETAAECAAIVCCCPCGIANLLFTAAVKLPAGLVRRALRHKRKHGAGFGKRKAGLFRNRIGSLDDDDFGIYSGSLLVALEAEETWPVKVASPELVALEKEMSARFYSAGFWRSPSQKE